MLLCYCATVPTALTVLALLSLLHSLYYAHSPHCAVGLQDDPLVTLFGVGGFLYFDKIDVDKRG